MKRYPAYKDSGIEWIGDIPEHWKVKPLKYTVKINQHSLPENTHEDYEIQYIDIGNVNQDGLVNPPKVMSFDISPSRARRVVKKGDTIVSTVRTYLKAIAYINSEDENLIASTGFAVLTPTNLMHAMYLYYVISTQKIIDNISSLSVGVSYPAINSSEFGSIPIWFPKAIEEQQTIANYLDRKTHLIYTLIENKQRLIDLLKEQRAAIINQAVTKGLNPNVKQKDSGIEWLGEIPEHWDVKKIAHFVEKLTNGYVGPTRDIMRDSGVPYVQGIHIKDNAVKFTYNGYYYVSEEWSNEHSRSILKENDILVVQTGSIGEVGIVPKELENANCHALIILRVKRDFGIPKYLLYVLSSDFGFHSFYSIRTGEILYHLNATKVRDIKLPVPEIEEQKKIVEYVEKKISSIKRSIDDIKRQIDILKEYRTALISEVVTGKIDVRDSRIQEVIHT